MEKVFCKAFLVQYGGFLVVQTPNSILPLQVIMHFDIIYSVFYSVFLLLISVYKCTLNNINLMIILDLGGLLYPPNIWELEISTIVFFLFIQVFRLYFGYHANR